MAFISPNIESNVDEVRQRLIDTFGGDNGEKILGKILKRLSITYKNNIVRNYLSGQYLGVRTGATKKAMIAYKVKRRKLEYIIRNRIQGAGKEAYTAGLANIYEHGAEIEPVKAKALCFEGKDGNLYFVRGKLNLPAKPFISDSAGSYNWGTQIDKNADVVIAREVKKFNESK